MDHPPASPCNCMQTLNFAKRWKLESRPPSYHSGQAGGFGFGSIEAARGLHQRVEAAPTGPRPFVSIGAQRHVYDARPNTSGILWAEPERRNGVRPIALDKNVRLPQQRGEDVAPA